jgi:hypothetical protein
MDTNREIVYIAWHETPWKFRSARKASPACIAPAKSRSQLPLCGHSTEVFPELDRPLATGLPYERLEGPPSSANTRATSIDRSGAETGACSDISRRRSESRLCNGSLDTEARWRGNQEALWGRLFHFQSLATDEGSGLELPDAGEESPGAKRTCHPNVEASGMARDKKKPKNFAPISFSWMKAVSCSYRALPAHGRQWDKPRIFLSQGGTGRRSRPSRLSVSLHVGSVSPSFSNFTPTEISAQIRSSSFSNFFFGISEAPSSCSGTETRFTGQHELGTFSEGTVEFTVTSSRGTHPNLTPMSLSGQISSEPWPICASPKMYAILGMRFPVQSGGFDILNDSCGLAFMRPNYRGHESVSIIY